MLEMQGLHEDGGWDDGNDPLEDMNNENNVSPVGAQYGQVWGRWG